MTDEAFALTLIVYISLFAPMLLMSIIFHGFSGNNGKGGGVDD